MDRLVAALLPVAMALAIMGGCRQSPPPEEFEVRPAPVHEVRVTTLQSNPRQVVVYVKGGLSDGCTTFHEAKVTGRTGNRIAIAVTTKRPREAICTQVYGLFEHNLNLGSDFRAGETYTIQVNDNVTTFLMP